MLLVLSKPPVLVPQVLEDSSVVLRAESHLLVLACVSREETSAGFQIWRVDEESVTGDGPVMFPCVLEKFQGVVS